MADKLLLSKVQINGQTYWLKDADLRAIVEGFSNAVEYNVATSFDKTKDELATSKAVAAYLENAIAGLTGAMHFIGVKNELPATGANGDVVIVGTAEYVYYDGEWALIGDEGVYATIEGVEKDYVKKSLTIAGIDLNDAITKAELQGALDLKALAYKASASGSITTADSVADATYTPAGDVAVELQQTSTKMTSTGKFTPVGTVSVGLKQTATEVASSGKFTPAGSVAVELQQTSTSVASTGKFTPAGTVSAPSVTVTPATATVKHIASLGTLPSYTAAQYTAPSVKEAKGSFATAGLTASIDSNDAEMLVFSAASTSQALTGTGFNAGSYTAASFNAGALPTYGAEMSVVTGIESASATAPTFTGSEGNLSVSGSYNQASVKSAAFTGSEGDLSVKGNYNQASVQSATFSGDEGDLSVNGNYNQASVKSAGFTGTEATIHHELNKSAKTVTVQ